MSDPENQKDQNLENQEAAVPSNETITPQVIPQSVEQEGIPSNQDASEVPVTSALEIPQNDSSNEQALKSPAKAFEVAKDSVTEEEQLENQPNPVNTTSVLQEKTDSIEGIDINAIATFLEVDNSEVSKVDAIVLQKLQARVTEFTDLKSEKLVLEVNLEQSTHLSNKRVELFKNQLSKATKEVSSLRESSSALEASKFELEKRLAELEGEYKTSTSASQLNQSKIDEILADKRSTVELLEKKNREIEDYKNELNQLQDSNSNLRKELIDLETTNQTTASSLTHSKFKIQSNETQIDLLTKSNDWLNKEIKTISDDFSDYRKQKAKELSTLQSDYDNKAAEFNSLKTRYDNLSARFDETNTKLDNALVEVKKLNDEKSVSQEEFFKEISLKDRLVKLLTKSNDDAKAKVSHLEELLDNSKSDVANESGALRTELEKYQRLAEQHELKIQQLETTIDDFSRTNSSNDPETPVLTPAAQAAAAKYPGISLSQLYSDFSLLKKQLTRERRAKERMQHQIDAFVNELEQKAPLINATKERVEVLENELTNLSVILESTTSEKESIEKSYTELNNKLQASSTQISTLNKQKVDLARQVQSLLVQVSIRGDSRGPMTPAEKEAFNRIASGDEVVNQSDTDRLISERLVVFQNVVDLQNKNQELLRITRELGSRLEQEEQVSKSRLESLESSAISEAKDAILTLQEEIKSTETKLSSVTRERDMFRSMLANKSTQNYQNILTGDLSCSAPDSSNEANKQRLDQLEKELQSTQEHLKAIKVESETTINLLNKQLNALSSEKSELAISLAKEKSSNTLVEERYKSLQENIKYSRSENVELRKRSELLQENLAKQDQRTQQVAEELIQTKSLIESLRSETSNLKAEKQLWKSIEKRLTEENISLIEEKSKLNSLLVNLQSLERERESNASESQKRLVSQTEALEKEVTSLRQKIADGANELKDVLTRKEADGHAYQEKIDALRSEIGTAREELITKKSALEQVQAQVEVLTSKLTSAETRLRDLQSITSSDTSESTLVQETLQLKSELEEAKISLEESGNNVAEFKKIASAAEEALKSMNESFDDYKTNTGNKVAKLEAENKALNERVSVLNDQITSLNNELVEQKNVSLKELDTAKQELETIRSKFTDSSKLQKDYDAKVAVIDSSYRQQVAIAAEAQQNYEKELQKHAEVAKAVSLLREESNDLKQTIQQLSSEAKQSKGELEKSRNSWESQKSTLEEELRTAKNRVDDLSSQNHILYNQIESLSAKQSTNETRDSEDGDLNLDDPNNELRELISLLRREKEISDAHLEVATRDLKRVSQKLDLVTAELDRSRLELNKLQTRDVDAERLAQDHQKLLEEINQLNLLRESNTTLRNEVHNNNARVLELEKQLSDANAKVEPLETTIVKLNAEITQKGQELRLTVEEKDRWKQRSQDILNKYDRVDPQEHEKIKEEIKSLTTKNQELSKELEEQKKKVTDTSDRLDRLKNEAQDKLKRSSVHIKQVTAQLQEAQNEVKSLKESGNDNNDKLATQVKDLQSKLENASKADKSKEIQEQEAEKARKELESLRTSLTETKAQLEKSKEYEKKFNDLSALKDQLESKVKSLETEIQSLKETSKAPVSSESSTETSAELKKLQDSLAAKNKEIEEVTKQFQSEKENFEKEIAAKASSTPAAQNGSEEASLKAQEAKLRAEFETESAKKVETALEDLRRRLREPSEAKIKSVIEARSGRIQKESDAKLKEATTKLEQEYKKKSEALEKEYKEKLSKANTVNDSEGSDASAIKAKYEEQIAELKKELEEAKKKSFSEGREATLKETGMRTKLLQGKVEKLTKEKKELEEKLGGSKLPDIPGKPNIPPNTNQNRNSKIPVNTTKQQTKQPQPQQQNDNKAQAQPQTQDQKAGGANQNKNDNATLKRPADQQAAAPQEKKSKNDN